MVERFIAIRCEILAPDDQKLVDLGKIAKACAIDLGINVPLVIGSPQISRETESAILLKIPKEIAVLNDEIWRLASRIACFCPEIRVSTQICSESNYSSIQL